MLRNVAKMSSSVSTHRIMVRGYPTEVLCVGQSIEESPRNVILFVPGNPGIAAYYVSTMQKLYQLLGGSHSIWSISHAGQCLTLPSVHPGWEHVYDYKSQVKHKIAFIEDHIAKDANITLVGHSVGCSIILRLLKHFENTDIKIAYNYMLFPAVERMKTCPGGRRVWPILVWLRWFVIMLVYIAYYLPEMVKDKLIRLYFWHEIAECNVVATKELLHPKVIQNFLWMAYFELQEVTELDVETVTKNKDKILFYYGTRDNWAPVKYYEEMKDRVKGVNAILCKDEIEHAYVLGYCTQVAEKLAEWIKA